MSVMTAMARRPRALTSAAAESISSRCGLASTTSAPSCARRSEIALPMARPPPVTIATRPCRFILVGSYKQGAARRMSLLPPERFIHAERDSVVLVALLFITLLFIALLVAVALLGFRLLGITLALGLIG